MRARTLLSLAAGAASIGLTHPVAAQDVARFNAVRPVATYHIGGTSQARDLPHTLVIADSAGQLVASYRSAADGAAHAMIVEVQGSDLVLRADTERGPLEFVLYGQNEAITDRFVAGRWVYGQREGALRGRVKS